MFPSMLVNRISTQGEQTRQQRLPLDQYVGLRDRQGRELLNSSRRPFDRQPVSKVIQLRKAAEERFGEPLLIL